LREEEDLPKAWTRDLAGVLSSGGAAGKCNSAFIAWSLLDRWYSVVRTHAFILTD
jgi:hypothetical protein